MKRDPWIVLGLPRTADDQQIKDRYRSLARELHPDRNPGNRESSQRFQDVSWAYDVLRTEESRLRWQAESESPLDFAGEQQDGGTLQVTFLEAFRGTQQEVRVESDEVCRHCAGSGSAPGATPRRCGRCNGSGSIALAGISQICESCTGRGYTLPHPCSHCQWGRIKSSRTVLVHISPGVVDGQEILVSDGPRQFLFQIEVEPSPVFQRSLPDPADLLVEVPVSFAEALFGADVRLPTPDRVIELRLPAGSSSGRTLRVQGAGMPRADRSRGDLYARIEIDVPEEPSAELRRLAEQVEAETADDLRARLFRF
jgi:molecular chaperone DnaJ